ncbi:zinc ABC transporter substrate-binding protein [Gloeocapsopsis crepidinum LEGE 06123]|uniref:Zinc ABC transporter substrate-binding protein n=1 Tax=Gloeocapsopsis crepidinum LEGE 06123 TaxID=588587 RepID=A0ABR9UM85_9CHRO|nr:metal ABC transporter substrate-binding protein [Gloeocapsopsis crepidinum]MBE9189407.1 zinc ABC transporter substrate-binding protein [Gloeocapsopsis crepidinum LEGE 06123]
MSRQKIQQRRHKHNILSLVTLLLLATASGCNQAPQETQTQQTQEASAPQSEQIRVVTTFLPMYWFTRAVVGDRAQVEILVPPGSEVHDYQATPADVQAIATADVLVKNGLGMEDFLDSTIQNAENPNLQQIDASSGIETVGEISPVESAGDHGHSHSHGDSDGGNPHVWLDPVLAKQQVENIRDGLVAADPANRDAYQANAAAYIQQLEQTHNQFQQSLQKYPNCTFITFHDAYPYLANRYQLQQVAVVEIPEDQPSPGDVQRAVNAVKKYDAQAIFSEPGVDNSLIQSLSQDLNLTVYSIDPLEAGSTDPQHYFTAMSENLQTIESACQ